MNSNRFRSFWLSGLMKPSTDTLPQMLLGTCSESGSDSHFGFMVKHLHCSTMTFRRKKYLTPQIMLLLNVLPWLFRVNRLVPNVTAGRSKSGQLFSLPQEKRHKCVTPGWVLMVAAGGKKSARAEGWQSWEQKSTCIAWKKPWHTYQSTTRYSSCPRGAVNLC